MKGILMRPWKHQAIRENPDKEWQTRRLSGLKEINLKPDRWTIHQSVRDIKPSVKEGDWLFISDDTPFKAKLIKPRYQVGEVVYIKEMWFVGIEYDALSPSGLWNHPPVGFMVDYKFPSVTPGRLRSPLVMPAWAARTFIRITGVRAERFYLKKLTSEELIKEGGEEALKILREYEGKWLWVYSFRKSR